MAGETTITLIGNLVDDPELRFTPSGAGVAKFRVASTPRFFDKTTNEWKDGESLFLTCSVWRHVAENVAESLTKGMRVIVQGRLRQRSYETNEGEKRTVYELDVEEVGPSLRNANHRESFPSSHSATAMALSTVLATYYPHAAITFWALAVGTAIIRYVLDAHWPSDILVGLALGYAVAREGLTVFGVA